MTTIFGSRPNSAAISLSGQSNVVIDNKWFHDLGTNVIAITLSNCTNITISSCDFENVVGCVFALNCSNISVVDSRYHEIGDGTIGSGHSNFVQFNNVTTGSVARNNGLGGHTEDIVSLFKSSYITVEDNHFEGTDWSSGSGTGTIVGDGGGGNYVIVRNNTYLTPGAVGIQLIGGVGILVYGNTLYSANRTPLAGPNVGMSSYSGSPQAEVYGNRVKWYKNDGSENPYWWGSGAINAHDNDWHATIDPVSLSVTFPPPGAGTTYAATIIADSPSAYWRAGPNANDSIGTANGTYVGSPTLNAAGLLTGDAATSVTLDGSTQYMTVPDSAAVDLGDTFTLECWVQRSNLGVESKLFSKGSGAYFMGVSWAGGVQIARQGYTIISTTSALLANTNIHHVVWTKSGATNHIYIDSVDRTGAVTNDTCVDNANQLVIGAFSDYTLKFGGGLQEAATYKTALTSTQVAEHYVAGTTVPSAALAGTAASRSGASAALRMAVAALAGTAASRSGASAALRTGSLLAGTAASHSAASAVLTTASHGRSLEAEYDIVPFSGGRKARAIDLLEAINLATGSRHYVSAGVTEATWYAYTAVNRHHKLDAAVDETIDDALDMDAYELDIATVGNQQSVVATPTVLQEWATVWTCPSVPISLQAGHSQDLWLNFDGFVIGAALYETHTGTLTVTPTYFGDSAKITLTATTDATLTWLHVAGYMAVATSGVSVFSEDATSALPANSGPQAMPEIDTPLLGSSALAQGLADHLVWRFKDPHPRPVVRRLNKFPSMIARRLFDVVALTHPRQSLTTRRFEVVGLSGEIEPGADWIVSYQLQEAPSQTALQFFKLGGSAAEGIGGTGVLAR